MGRAKYKIIKKRKEKKTKKKKNTVAIRWTDADS